MKLKTLIKEVGLENRGIFVIDDSGKIHSGMRYHGEIVFRFDWLYDTAKGMFKTDKSIKIAASAQNKKLMDMLYSSGFILGGIWSPSKRELYVAWAKPTHKAELGLLKKISDYKPTGIYVENIKTGGNKMYTTEEFIEEYL